MPIFPWWRSYLHRPWATNVHQVAQAGLFSRYGGCGIFIALPRNRQRAGDAGRFARECTSVVSAGLDPIGSICAFVEGRKNTSKSPPEAVRVEASLNTKQDLCSVIVRCLVNS